MDAVGAIVTVVGTVLTGGRTTTSLEEALCSGSGAVRGGSIGVAGEDVEAEVVEAV